MAEEGEEDEVSAVWMHGRVGGLLTRRKRGREAASSSAGLFHKFCESRVMVHEWIILS